VEKKLQAAELDNGETVQSISDMSQCYDASCKDSVKIESLPGTRLSNAIQNCQYIILKSAYSEPGALLKPIDQASEKCNIDRSYVLDSDLSDCIFLVQAPATQFSVTKGNQAVVISHDDKKTESVKLRVDESITLSVRDCVAARPEPGSKGGTPKLSDSQDTVYKGDACCSSSCDCFSFCDSSSSSVEFENDTVQRNKVNMDGLGIYIGCDGSHIVTCDLHLVGAWETVSDCTESTTSIFDGQLVSGADNEHEDFVDNTCVDCGCELASDSMTECVYSVPICNICSKDNVPFVDIITSSDHSYARLSTDHIVCPSPLKQTHPSSSAICQQSEMPDTDVVDDITFLSFPSKLLMHKYISYQQNVCDPSVKGSWTELARCQRSWHGSHKSHRSVWLGSTRHRRYDRFSTHNRLNEQIELGLVKPLSAQSSTDLFGIKLKTSLVHDNTDKTITARKVKCQSRHVSSDWQMQRPTRMAARDQHYCVAHYWQRRCALKRDPDAEHINLTKLTRQQVKDALELLQVPLIITRNSCCQPGMLVSQL